MYLLDTNVISKMRRGRKANIGLVKWASKIHASTMFLSIVKIFELELGILLMEKRDSSQGAILRTWMNAHISPTFSNRILMFDLAIAQCAVKLHVPNPCSDRDAMIAASALVHSMTVVTRNVKDFTACKVKTLNPWQ